MRRAKCKGRTLCLKVKLHTFEVLTRQVVPPKAVFLADDLYSYSLPMLAKLEQEFPSLRLRLLGLRCTHLVSTKPPDTASFFGLRPRLPDADDSTIRDQEGEWEQWPDEPLPGHDPGSGETPPAPSEEVEGYRRHGKEITANPQKGESIERELWDCPICSRPQAADERRFNEHIDLCLSRQAIRDTVQQEGAALSVATTTTTMTPPPSVDKKSKKRTRQPAEVDPRQTKLRFG
jgi:DNA polymerase kappa